MPRPARYQPRREPHLTQRRRLATHHDERAQLSKQIYATRARAQKSRLEALLSRALAGRAMRELRAARRPRIRIAPPRVGGGDGRAQWPATLDRAAKEAMCVQSESHLLKVRQVAESSEQGFVVLTAGGIRVQFLRMQPGRCSGGYALVAEAWRAQSETAELSLASAFE